MKKYLILVLTVCLIGLCFASCEPDGTSSATPYDKQNEAPAEAE